MAGQCSGIVEGWPWGICLVPRTSRHLKPPDCCQPHSTDEETEAPGYCGASWTKKFLQGKSWQGWLLMPTPSNNSITGGKESDFCRDKKPQVTQARGGRD